MGQSIAEIEAVVAAEQAAKQLERRTAEVNAEKETVIKLQKCERSLSIASALRCRAQMQH